LLTSASREREVENHTTLNPLSAPCLVVRTEHCPQEERMYDMSCQYSYLNVDVEGSRHSL
jgi:hypothetical protein